MAEAELPHHELAQAADRLVAAREAVDAHEHAEGVIAYEAAGGNADLARVFTDVDVAAHRADAEAAGIQAGINYDTVQTAIDGIPEVEQAPDATAPVTLPELPTSPGAEALPPLPDDNEKAA